MLEGANPWTKNKPLDLLVHPIGKVGHSRCAAMKLHAPTQEWRNRRVIRAALALLFKVAAQLNSFATFVGSRDAQAKNSLSTWCGTNPQRNWQFSDTSLLFYLLRSQWNAVDNIAGCQKEKSRCNSAQGDSWSSTDLRFYKICRWTKLRNPGKRARNWIVQGKNRQILELDVKRWGCKKVSLSVLIGVTQNTVHVTAKRGTGLWKIAFAPPICSA